MLPVSEATWESLLTARKMLKLEWMEPLTRAVPSLRGSKGKENSTKNMKKTDYGEGVLRGQPRRCPHFHKVQKDPFLS